MPDEPAQPAKGTLLRAYLASHDAPCERCGYNLRGIQDVFCPECGLVIPRPPVEQVERFRATPADLKLYCRRCGYTVTGVNADRCPECGQRNLARFTGASPPPRRRWKLLPRGLSVILAGEAACGAMVAIGDLFLWIEDASLRRAVSNRMQLALSMALALAPAAITIIWMRSWRRTAAMGDWTRRAWSLGAIVFAGFLLAAAVRTMR